MRRDVFWWAAAVTVVGVGGGLALGAGSFIWRQLRHDGGGGAPPTTPSTRKPEGPTTNKAGPTTTTTRPPRASDLLTSAIFSVQERDYNRWADATSSNYNTTGLVAGKTYEHFNWYQNRTPNDNPNDQTQPVMAPWVELAVPEGARTKCVHISAGVPSFTTTYLSHAPPTDAPTKVTLSIGTEVVEDGEIWPSTPWRYNGELKGEEGLKLDFRVPRLGLIAIGEAYTDNEGC